MGSMASARVGDQRGAEMNYPCTYSAQYYSVIRTRTLMASENRYLARSV